MTELYFLNLKKITLGEEYVSLLPGYRRKKFDRLKNDRARLESLGAGILMKKFFGDREPGVNTYGKPYFGDGVCFNLSHSGSFAVLAVSGTPVGCDIERVRELEFEKLGKVVFCDNELEYIRKADSAADAFFRVWTRKEAFIKLLGEGFHFPPKSIDLSCADSVAYKDKRFFFKEYMLSDCKIMLCSAEKSFPEAPVEVEAF